MSDKILTALRAAEWATEGECGRACCFFCPVCEGPRDQYRYMRPPGHKPDCVMAEAIAEAEQIASKAQGQRVDPYEAAMLAVGITPEGWPEPKK